MATCYLAAIGNGTQFFTPQGVVLVGGFLRTKVAGTSTDLQTFTDSTGTVPNTNPIVLGSDGRPPQEIWAPSGSSIKFILTDSAGVSVPNATYDYIPLINDPGSASGSASPEWTSTGLTPSPIDSTHFSVVGNQTAIYQPGRRVRLFVTAGTIYGTIATSIYGSVTTVTVVLDNGAVIDGGLSAANVSFLSAINGSVPSVLLYGLNNTPIGQTTANVGTFTTLTASNLVIKQSFLALRTSLNFASGSGFFTVPAGVTTLLITASGGGGGGGSGATTPYCGGGGGGAAFCFLYPLTVTPGASLPFSVGVGGQGGNGGSTGAAGTATTVGTLTLNPGQGGSNVTGGFIGGAGGSTGVVGVIPGTSGGNAFGGGLSGGGGSSLFGGAPPQGTGISTSNSFPGITASYGGGGGSGACVTAAGGNGGNGILIIQW